MQTHRTAAPHTRNTGPVWALAVLLVIGMAVALGVSQRQHRPLVRVNAADGDPAIAVPAQPSTERRQLTLRLDLPALTDEQRYWMRQTQAIPRLPIAFGLDEPPIPFTDNEAVVWTALIFTECGFRPFRDGAFLVNEIGATGCGQLMGPLVTPETASNPSANIYAAAREFRRLIDASGDLMEAVRSYKGVATADTTYQANSIFDVIRLGQ